MAARFQSACQIAWKSSLFIFVNLFTETGKNEESAAGENLEPNAANAEVRITFSLFGSLHYAFGQVEEAIMV